MVIWKSHCYLPSKIISTLVKLAKHAPSQATNSCLMVTGYREGAWFKNNFAKVFYACNYYAGVATTSNAVSFRSLWNKSALQQSAWSYLTRAQRYSRHTVQIFTVSFQKLCASIRPSCFSSILNTQILLRDWRDLFWIIVLVVEKIRKMSWSYL